ncbi:replication initiation protein [Aureibacter tunicatorum]|uniref:Plasmid replication initiation protein n=1 Tax=Aureibacter tunicatorum TaxID=866807 RepID=A0AAE3XSW2_9BACT|nr:replication initiation protein [Aureibacter tunicatorum]MDR6241850.1 plasmid replication initiation protein [Aureibacter tunicatorum]BDD07097.1 hypothetical protein AUTU_45800 [Aureibacter tunicatorum]
MAEFDLAKLGDYKIVKSNKLIDSSRQNFSALQMRIITLMCARIRPDDDEFKEYEISMAEILDGKSVSGKAYNDVKKAAKGLAESAVHIEDDQGHWKTMSFITMAEGKPGWGYVKLKFSSDMKPFFLSLKERYTSYLVKNVTSFRKQYTLRIYELCKQYYPNIREREIQIVRLKEIFSLLEKDDQGNILSEKYRTVAMFHSRIILPSIEEINEYSDIFVSFQQIKKGRKIVAYKFFIEPNPKYKAYQKIKKHELEIKETEQVIANQNFDEHELVEPQVDDIIVSQNEDEELNTVLFSKSDLKEIRNECAKRNLDDTFVAFAVKYVEEQHKVKSVNKPKLYILKGLMSGWLLDEFEKNQAELKLTARKREKERQRLTIEKLTEQLRETYQNKYLQVINSYSDEEVLSAYSKGDFEESISNPLYDQYFIELSVAMLDLEGFRKRVKENVRLKTCYNNVVKEYVGIVDKEKYEFLNMGPDEFVERELHKLKEQVV